MRTRPLGLAFVIALTVGAFATACGDDGNNTNPDAAVVDAPPTSPDGPPVVEEVCEVLPPVTSGAACAVTAGDTRLLIKGNILTPTKVFKGGGVAVDASGIITCAGCGCDAAGATTVVCPDAAISPGLINTHDHITFTQNSPYTDQGFRYEHRHQWRQGAGPTHPKIPAAGSATDAEISWGELRFVMGGATSIVGSGGANGLLRNLDRAPQQEGLAQTAVKFDTFPLGDSDGTTRTADCNYGTATTAASIMSVDAYEPHTSEGIDREAHNEFLCESDPSYDTMAPGVANDLVIPKTAMIHAVGLLPADMALMAGDGTGMIWSPRSNITLYGDTARVSIADRLGVEIALGTDWMPTGSMNLLRELKCADGFNSTYLDHHFTDEQLWAMVTKNAAALTATDDVIGTLAVGKVADIAVFKGHGGAYRAVIDAEPQDVVLVVRGGKALYGDDTVVAALGTACDAVDVCGTAKRVCAMSEVGKTYDALHTAAGGDAIYPAFQCGVPMNEPSCTPKRPLSVSMSTVYTGMPTADDSDGDGLPNQMDKCPMVFDPARPLDNGAEGDADGDGVGDACDPCPFDANTTTCTSADPNDRDHDMVPNATDNCPDNANTNQADADMDGKGDVCDACPTQANPGAAGCSVTIYSIKNGTTPVGAAVRISDALVTGKGANGFFVQVKPGDVGYIDADYSGLFVFDTTPAHLALASVGARVTIDGSVASFQGQIELASVTTVTQVTLGPEAPPAPVVATYDEVKTGGTRAAKLEGVLVTLGPATVTAVDTAFGEFTLTDAAMTKLVVDDFLYATPNPTVGMAYTAATGILSLRSAGGGVSAMKLLPRSAADLSSGAPALQSIGPTSTFTRVGAVAAPTFPAPLTVTLTGPAQGDTVVTVTSGDAASLVTMNVTVPNGATSATVPVTGLAQAATVGVMATLGGTTLATTVRVLGATEAPTAVTLTPTDATVAPAGTVVLTATLDIPAPMGGTAVTVTVTPSSAGTVTSPVTVPANQISAMFTYQQVASTGTATVSAQFGASAASTSTITVASGAMHLVINELEYNEVMADTMEYAEIYNPTAAAISLAGKALVLVNGATSTTYATVDLAPGTSIAAGGYLVIGPAGVISTVPAGTATVTTTWNNFVQNGAPDGVALIDSTAHTLIDAVSYQGSITAVTLPGFSAPSSLVEPPEMAATVLDSNVVAQSICRLPNGADTDHAATDWANCTNSPGAANATL